MTPKLSQKISQAPLAQRFEHLLAVMSSERFLHMRGLNNDLPFYICEFPASQATDIERLQRDNAYKRVITAFEDAAHWLRIAKHL